MSRPGKREDLGLQLITVSRRYRRMMDAVFAEHGLSDASTLPLRFLIRQDRPYRQKDLAEELDIEGPTLVRVLDTLVAQGFVQRAEDPGDRRAKLVTATDAGRGFLAALAGRLDLLRGEIFAGVDEADVDSALTLLAQLDANMQALGRRD
ncbi:MarR family winged helix-turn-helix transcriptional regulator [Mangrovicoccus ximenensis]|uniref:MarR family winged helix-turn-helix transcriptional regulator n=1 Tax=Mangrovicoccus ximenensis TaxID=1911570 RepID=UPI000D3B5E80|nr:MarR family transcriptional regulator [Mangrovicoccus ximenensis]